MTDVRAFKALSLLTTIGALGVTACTIQLRGGEDFPPVPKAEQMTGATSSDLVRCRSVTSEETAGYQHCKRVWAENRSRFFGKKDGAAAPDHENSAPSVTPASKSQSRLPQGYPYLAIPEVTKP
jgi:conjugative transfer region protein TrbK